MHYKNAYYFNSADICDIVVHIYEYERKFALKHNRNLKFNLA